MKMRRAGRARNPQQLKSLLTLSSHAETLEPPAAAMRRLVRAWRRARAEIALASLGERGRPA